MVTACEYGTGPIDAVYKAVNKIVQVDNELTEFSVQSVTRGIDALGEVTIRVTAPDGGVYTGRGRGQRHHRLVHEGLPQRAEPPAQRQAGASSLAREANRQRRPSSDGPPSFPEELGAKRPSIELGA